MKQRIHEILLVDDDEITNFCSQNLLASLQLADTITVANDGKEALTYIGEHWSKEKTAKKLIVLDINMPQMDGFEFLDELKKLALKPKIYVVFLTSSDYQKDYIKAAQYRILDYIEKPLKADTVKSLVASILTPPKEKQPATFV